MLLVKKILKWDSSGKTTQNGYIFFVHALYYAGVQIMQILTIDGQFLIYKSLFSHQKLTADFNGLQVISGIPFGFLKAIIDMKAKFVPDFILVTFEGHPLLKKSIYPQYKEKRQKLEIDIKLEGNLVRAILHSLRIPALFAPGYEGEDVAKFIRNHGVRKKDFGWFYTNDHDAFALIRNNFVLINNVDGNYYVMDKEALLEQHDITPKEAREIIILEGCNGDNVEGFAGIGPAFAKYLIKKYGTARRVVRDINETEKKYIRLNDLVAKSAKNLTLMKEVTGIQLPGYVRISDSKIKESYTEILDLLECHTLMKGANKRILKLIAADQKKWYKKMAKRLEVRNGD
jgi:5'-3' exonuclease